MINTQTPPQQKLSDSFMSHLRLIKNFLGVLFKPNIPTCFVIFMFFSISITMEEKCFKVLTDFIKISVSARPRPRAVKI